MPGSGGIVVEPVCVTVITPGCVIFKMACVFICHRKLKFVLGRLPKNNVGYFVRTQTDLLYNLPNSLCVCVCVVSICVCVRERWMDDQEVASVAMPTHQYVINHHLSLTTLAADEAQPGFTGHLCSWTSRYHANCSQLREVILYLHLDQMPLC